MARRRTRKKNPESGATSLLVIGGIAVAGYLAYVNGWLSSLFGTTAATTATATAAPVTGSVSPTAAAVVGTPALGTTVTSVAQAAAQAAANYPYIIPDSNTNASLMSTGLNGYATINTTDVGTVWCRMDVYNAVNATNANRIARLTANYAASNTTPTTAVLQNATNITLVGIKQIMSTNGLSGMAMVNARSVFPYNPIMGGMGILNAPQGWN